MGWVVNATPQPLYPLERPDTHSLGGWLGPRAGVEFVAHFRQYKNSPLNLPRFTVIFLI